MVNWANKLNPIAQTKAPTLLRCVKPRKLLIGLARLNENARRFSSASDSGKAKDAYYRGPGWYATTFLTPDEWAGKRVFLRFQGVSSVADVYLNGTHLGQHRGGDALRVTEVGPAMDHPVADRIEFVARLAAAWARLRPPTRRRPPYVGSGAPQKQACAARAARSFARVLRAKTAPTPRRPVARLGRSCTLLSGATTACAAALPLAARELLPAE